MTDMNTATQDVAPSEEIVDTNSQPQDVVQNTEQNQWEQTPTEPEKTEETQSDESQKQNTDSDVTQILDNIFKELELEVSKDTQPKKVWPNITETIHESEAKILLDTLQKELDAKKESETVLTAKNEELISELEAIKKSKEEDSTQIEKQKEDIAMMEEFFQTLAKVPVLWDLVNAVILNWPDAVDIPKYLKDMVESKIMAQNINPSTGESVPPTPVSASASLEAAILRRNKR